MQIVFLTNLWHNCFNGNFRTAIVREFRIPTYGVEIRSFRIISKQENSNNSRKERPESGPRARSGSLSAMFWRFYLFQSDWALFDSNYFKAAILKIFNSDDQRIINSKLHACSWMLMANEMTVLDWKMQSVLNKEKIYP